MSDVVTNSAGKELIDATQEAVIGAVSNVENILQTKTAEIAEHHSELFYQSPEFWVGAAFVLVVIGLFCPISKVLRGLLTKKIDGIVQQIQSASDLRDEARRLLADYEQRMDGIKSSSDEIVRKADKEAAAFREREVKKLESELAAQEKYTNEMINAFREKAVSESERLVAARTADILQKAVSTNLTDERKSALIDASINRILSLK